MDVKLGLAADSLESLIMNGEAGRYDSKHQDSMPVWTRLFELSYLNKIWE